LLYHTKTRYLRASYKKLSKCYNGSYRRNTGEDDTLSNKKATLFSQNANITSITMGGEAVNLKNRPASEAFEESNSVSNAEYEMPLLDLRVRVGLQYCSCNTLDIGAPRGTKSNTADMRKTPIKKAGITTVNVHILFGIVFVTI
jgi:hypothetical protein